ncbi:hypothetical protein AGMMS50262_18700 [Bacteroidia bacterium]|nr:hypothetical protein AGMMS50262_18700 [Bacteroidia bacterium]
MVKLDFSVLKDISKGNNPAKPNVRRISIAGIHRKLSAIEKDNKICLTPDREQGTHILKLVPTRTYLITRILEIPANECLTMEIARQVYHIPTAESTMGFFYNRQPVYITKRFDVNPDGTKKLVEDFASLAGKTGETHGKYYASTGSYVLAGKLIKKYISNWQPEMIKFFRLVLFNYIISNSQAHLKDFSVLRDDNGEYILAPAYDLLNTQLFQFWRKGQPVFGLEDGLFEIEHFSDDYLRNDHPSWIDFTTFGKLIELPSSVIQTTLEEFLTPQPLFYDLVERSFLGEFNKKLYIQTYEERLKFLKGR